MIAFAMTALIVELTPGPNMVYLATVAIGQGRRRALMAVAGVALGLAVVGALAALGLAAALDVSSLLYGVLRYGGALYLLWLAFDAWRDRATGAAGEIDDFASFRRGLVTNLLNPKAAIFYVAILPTFIDPARGGVIVQNLALVAVYLAIATAIHAAIAISGDRLRPLLFTSANERIVRRTLAAALALIAVWFLVSTRR